MIANGVAVGQVREHPSGGWFRVGDVWEDHYYDGPRCSVHPLKDYPQPRPVYPAVYSTSYVSRWPVIR